MLQQILKLQKENKMKLKVSLIAMALIPAFFTLPVNAEDQVGNSNPFSNGSGTDPLVLVQRNCDPGDLIIVNKMIGSQTVTTNCLWKKQRVDANGNIVLGRDGQPINEDADMQVSLFVARDVDYVKGTCTFKHAANSQDKIVDVSTSKAGNSSQSAKPKKLDEKQYAISSDGTKVLFVFKLDKKDNFDATKNGYQANVIFDLNKDRSDRWPWQDDVYFSEGNTLTCNFQPNPGPSLAD